MSQSKSLLATVSLGHPNFPQQPELRCHLSQQQMTTFGASGAPGGARQGGREGVAGERVAREGPPRKSYAALSHAAELRRPSAPGVALRASSPLPPSCDKRRRERAEPTFTTAGTSEASLLNPVSNGYQHRASNVIRPAAAATSLRGEPGARARAGGRARSPCSRGDSERKHGPAGAGLTFSPRASPGT